MKIEIKNRWSGEVIFAHEAENNSMSLTVKAALDASVSLSDANLSGANLSDADMSRANLIGANLSGADMSRANLSDANLIGANLSGADMSRANLIGANLIGATLSGANLTPIRDDIFAVLSAAPAEVPALIEALKSGKVDGSTYEGDCCCLVGTIANAKGCEYRFIETIKPNSSRPAERFFLGINKGDTPDTNQFSALALQWAEEWLCRMQSAFGQNK